MPPEGAPAVLRDRITAGRNAVVVALAEVVRPGLGSSASRPTPAHRAHALGGLRRGGAPAAHRPRRVPDRAADRARRLAAEPPRALGDTPAGRPSRELSSNAAAIASPGAARGRRRRATTPRAALRIDVDHAVAVAGELAPLDLRRGPATMASLGREDLGAARLDPELLVEVLRGEAGGGDLERDGTCRRLAAREAIETWMSALSTATSPARVASRSSSARRSAG